MVGIAGIYGALTVAERVDQGNHASVLIDSSHAALVAQSILEFASGQN